MLNLVATAVVADPGRERRGRQHDRRNMWQVGKSNNPVAFDDWKFGVLVVLAGAEARGRLIRETARPLLSANRVAISYLA